MKLVKQMPYAVIITFDALTAKTPKELDAAIHSALNKIVYKAANIKITLQEKQWPDSPNDNSKSTSK